jgi:hypothetical protein
MTVPDDPTTRAELSVGDRLWHCFQEVWGTVTPTTDRPSIPFDEVEMTFDDGREVIVKCRNLSWSDKEKE